MGVANEGACHMTHTHAVLMALRLLLRDEMFQHLLLAGTDPLPVLVQVLSFHIQFHFSSSLGEPQAASIANTDLLKELTSQSNSKCVGWLIVKPFG